MKNCGATLATALVLAMLAFSVAAHAHLGVDAQLARLDREIAADPENAGLHLRRGDLHRLHRDWPAAVRDLDTARRLDPGLAAVDLCLGNVLLDAGEPRQALEPLGRFIERHPGHGKARLLLARALRDARRTRDAVAEYTRAIECFLETGRPEPDCYLERARTLAEDGEERLDEALRGLDEGIAALGPLVALQAYAVELEERRGCAEDAVARIDRLVATHPAPELWLERRARVLEEAGRPEEAFATCAWALDALMARPAHRRRTAVLVRLEKRLNESIERLDRELSRDRAERAPPAAPRTSRSPRTPGGASGRPR